MITKKELEQYRQYSADYDQYIEKLRLCKSRLQRLETSAGFQNSRDPNLRNNYNETKAELQKIIANINEVIRNLSDMDVRIENALNMIPKLKVRQVLRQYYILAADDMEDIAATLGISRRSAYRLHNEGLQMIEALQK